jgi:16S rRNA (adenine1518-N6/adenine1519-N6)-dimethyltransferase
MHTKEKVKAKKRLGQHFLVDSNIAKNIVDALSLQQRIIIELGPGMGILTFFLVQIPDKEIHLIEIDEEATAYLRAHFPSLDNKLHRADFLKIDIRQLVREPFALIGNFPYNISNQILFKVLEYKDQVQEVVGMFQKEVALRIASKPGKKDYGILSVLLQAYYDIEYLFTVDEYVFNPPPKVKSAVVRLRRNNCIQLGCNENDFKMLVKTAFNQRRKTLRNSLKTITFTNDIQTMDLFNKRPEQLSVEEFVWLTTQISTNFHT